jgi:lysozyme family protein
MADFQQSVAKTLINEAGFQNLHGDSGNWTGGEVGVGEQKGTKYGISAAAFPTLDIVNLTTDQAREIYQTKYWNELYSSITDQLLADKLFDLGVLFGVGEAVKLLQITIVNKVSIVSDGTFGPATLAAINQQANLLPAYKTTFINHCMNIINHNPEKAQFASNWVRRINS